MHVYCDGLRCTKELDCHCVCRSAETMRKHWLTEHHFSLVKGRGHIRQQELHTVQETREHAMKRVTCQRFLTWCPASHYLHVRSPAEFQPQNPAPSSPDRFIQLTQELERMYLDGQQEIENTILAGTTDEANPWLRRTQWAQFRLIACWTWLLLPRRTPRASGL